MQEQQGEHRQHSKAHFLRLFGSVASSKKPGQSLVSTEQHLTRGMLLVAGVIPKKALCHHFLTSSGSFNRPACGSPSYDS